MRIKSIKPTNKYVYTTLKELQQEEDNYVLTPDGWQPVLAIEKIKHGPTYKVTSRQRSVICDPEHIFLTNNGPKYAKDLDNSNDKMVSFNGELLDFESKPGSREIDLYDIQIPSPHWYYTHLFVSHNSLLLCNNAFTSVRDGLNVLFITFELSSILSGMRIVGSMTGHNLSSFTINDTSDLSSEGLEKIRQIQNSIKHKASEYAKKAQIAIYELPPDECSVDNIYSIIEANKKSRGWRPDVVIIDYLELMTSRRSSMNDADYTRQKSVATEVRGLAKNENVLVFTATQTNREAVNTRGDAQEGQGRGRRGNRGGGGTIGLDKSAESFGKTMPVDYVISLNQTEEEYNMGRNNNGPSIIRLWVAKNRNGPKFVMVNTNVWYNRMQIKEVD